MHYLRLLVFISVLISSCQQSGSEGNTIVFGDVVGTYDGIAGTYEDDLTLLTDTEVTSILVSAIDQSSARVKSTSSRIADHSVILQTSTASEITFKSVISDTETLNLRYIASTDSIVLMHENWDGEVNLLFAGVRK